MSEAAHAMALLYLEHLDDLRAFVRLKIDPRLRVRESGSDLVQSICREVLEDGVTGLLAPPGDAAALGAALEREEDGDEYLFSDGTGTIRIDVDENAGEGELPLFELIGIEGTVASSEIDVSRWALLPIVTPAVIVEEPQVYG